MLLLMLYDTKNTTLSLV